MIDLAAIGAQLEARSQYEYERHGRTREELDALAAPMALRMRFDDATLHGLDETVLEMRRRGLSYPAIATVLDLYEGLSVHEDHVRSWLDRLGASKNPNMVRAHLPSKAAA